MQEMFATTIGKRCLRGHELQSRSVSEFAWNLCRRGMLYPQILMYRQPYVHPTHYTYTYGSISLMNKIPCTHATNPPPPPPSTHPCHVDTLASCPPCPHISPNISSFPHLFPLSFVMCLLLGVGSLRHVTFSLDLFYFLGKNNGECWVDLVPLLQLVSRLK